ncbi:MAG: tetratricopeptide repeat protein, partial [Alphaproteobacteria bacterium]|nr:tetratricopeptide repeat protein [Alphaproteobacteria bacterium]
DLLECPASGMPEFFMLVGQERENWFREDKNGNRTTNRETVKKFKNWLENPVNKHGKSMADKKTAKDFLPDDVRQKCLNGKCQLAMDDKNIFDFWNAKKEEQKHKEVEVKTYVIGYDEMYADALGSYKKQDFKQAAQKYENMIKKYPDNALLRNDLAATYNRLGRYDDAIKQVKEIVARIGDRSQYGAAQYNAGVAYEALGNWERALKNYKVAFANGNKNAKPGIDRVTNQMKFYKNQTNAGGRN